jgi:hypothetical protein
MITRFQIGEEYGISQATFDCVRHLLIAKETGKHGRHLYDIGDRDDFVLRCARNHISSFGGEGCDNAHVLPFHRFLCLKFLTTPQKEALSEIYQRRLTTDRFGLGYYKKLEKRFVARVPKELRATVKKRAIPTKKQMGAYEMFLNVIGVVTAYNHPLWLDNFLSFLRNAEMKVVVESVLTTRGRRRDHQLALDELSGQQWKEVALDLYTSIFYDIGVMSEADWRYYLSIILPSEKKSKILSRNMTTAELRMQEGTNAHFQETLQLVAVKLQRKIRGTLALKGDTFKQLHQLINMYTGVGKLTGDVDRPNVGGTFFQNISIVPSDREFKTINAEIKGRVADGQA